MENLLMIGYMRYTKRTLQRQRRLGLPRNTVLKQLVRDVSTVLEMERLVEQEVDSLDWDNGAGMGIANENFENIPLEPITTVEEELRSSSRLSI
jgi:hypothetical protein